MEEPIVTAKYAYPPVQEAIFSLTFEEAVPMDALRRFSEQEAIQRTYPTCSPLAPELSEDEVSEADDALGYVLRTADETALLRLTTTQFNYHQLPPYPGWEVASEAFTDAWRQFLPLAAGVEAAEAAVRYINQFSLPEEEVVTNKGVDLGKFLNILPRLPEGFPGAPGPFFLNLHTWHEERQLVGRVTEVMQPAQDRSPVPQVVLDITVECTQPQLTSPTVLTEFLSKARAFKNELFESCLTDACRNLFHQPAA